MKVNEVYEGDCLEVMWRLPDNFTNKDWDDEITFNSEVWREALRVSKPGATLMAFGDTRTHRLASAIEDAGWEIPDGD
jgi:DNA modification methylase